MELSEDWGEIVDPSEFTRAGHVPVVYHFQPKTYVRVAPERLQEWERYFVENVGIVPDHGRAASWMEQARSATMSGSHDCWDDADYV